VWAVEGEPTAWLRQDFTEGATIIAPRPDLKFAFVGPVSGVGMLIVLDETDVTAIATLTADGFSFRPLTAIAPGPHLVRVWARRADGSPLYQESKFVTRHTAAFAEAASDTLVAAQYEYPVAKHREGGDKPRSSTEADFLTDTRLREGGWDVGLTGYAKYYGDTVQLTPPAVALLRAGEGEEEVPFPLEEGFNLIRYAFRASYESQDFGAGVEAGNLVENVTPFSVENLDRRGGRATLRYRGISLRGFQYSGSRLYGFNGGTGFGGQSDDAVSGAVAGIELPDRRLTLRLVWADGSVPGDSAGIADAARSSKGDVLGAALLSDYFNGAVKTDFEYDRAHFDADTSDAFGRTTDDAWKLQAGGERGWFFYDLSTRRIGRDYRSIGNLGLQRDLQGYAGTAGLALAGSRLTLGYSTYNDNVEDDPLFATVISRQESVELAVGRWASLPMKVGFRRTLQSSADEPAGTQPVDSQLDAWSGSVGVVAGGVSLTLAAVQERLDDKTPANADTLGTTYNMSAAYAGSTLSTVAAVSRTTSELEPGAAGGTGRKTQTTSASFDLKSRFLERRLSCDAGGSWEQVDADGRSADVERLIGRARIAWSFRNLFHGALDPSVALRGEYGKSTRQGDPAISASEYTVFLVVSAAFPLSF